ncbi:MAG: hemin receptor [Anaerolineae bacterium]|nr:hemin receptor [Anaerolineae bacterium]
MSLTNAQKNIVKATFALVEDGDLLMACFYTRLFELDPSLRPMFKGNMPEQRLKLLQTLSIVIHGLDNLPTLVPAIQQLGKRHVTYGVQVHHWETVGMALLQTLADTFGSAFTDEVREAWAAAYTLIADTAMAAAYSQEEIVHE